MMQFKKKCVLDIDLKNLIFKVVFLQQMYSAVFQLWQKTLWTVLVCAITTEYNCNNMSYIFSGHFIFLGSSTVLFVAWDALSSIWCCSFIMTWKMGMRMRTLPNMPEVIRWPENNGTSSLSDFLERCLVRPALYNCRSNVAGDDLYKAFLYSRNRAPPYKTCQSKSFPPTISLFYLTLRDGMALILPILLSNVANKYR